MGSWKRFAAGHRKGGTAVSMVFVQPIPSLAAIERAADLRFYKASRRMSWFES